MTTTNDLLKTIIEQNKQIIEQNKQIIEQNKDTNKTMKYVELKSNLILEETESKTQMKYIEEDGGKLVPKTAMDIWQERKRKELAQQKYSRRNLYKNNDKNI